MPGLLLLQTNLNHSARAQDLFVATLAEWDIDLAVAAEPYQIPEHPNWAGDEDGSVAITWRHKPDSPPCSVVARGKGVVAVQRGKLLTVGCYISPNRSLPDFETYLGALGETLSRHPAQQTLVLGDFNAKSTDWGCPRTTVRGALLSEWMTARGLLTLNSGSTDTCVRERGGSIIDLSLATRVTANAVSRWRVEEGTETLSDHRYIRFDVSVPNPTPLRRRAGDTPRWSIRKMDEDALKAAAVALTWAMQEERRCVDDEADRFRELMTRVCDAGMPRVGSVQARRAVYWWTDEIASLRREANRSRRRYTRARAKERRGAVGAAVVTQLYAEYRQKCSALQLEIKRAKTGAWKELLGSVEKDPWGRPYKMVLNKLRPWTPPTTEALDPEFLGDVLHALFPRAEETPRPPPRPPDPSEWTRDRGVSAEELGRAMRRLGAKNTVPGPDGIPGKALVKVQGVLTQPLRQLFDDCLREGSFPRIWKEARLVLLRKEGKPADTPSAYRPICLLDETGKLFERILAARLVGHLSRTGPDVSPHQYGFREGRSTIDAIARVRALSDEVVSQGGMALAVSLDISNAFNSLPWDRIERALEHHRVPAYLRRVLGAYLSDRWVTYTDAGGGTRRRRVDKGVPQGSVLGPLLWNLGYDAVLRAPLPMGVSVTCYADDTLILARGEDAECTRRAAEEGAERVVASIEEMGLRVALDKTEALWIRAPRSRRPPETQLRVGRAAVRVGTTLKYLGLTLDGAWSFGQHFARLAPRLEKTAAALSRLLPNLGGPREGVRRLYASVMQSIALYGAPIWAPDLAASRRSRELLRGPWRKIAVRLIRGYRTVSHEAAGLLARLPPLELLAEAHARVYHDRAALRRERGNLDPAAVELARLRAREAVWESWEARLRELPRLADHWTVGAILPVMKGWRDRCHGGSSYRATQVLTGHGCFGSYLRRIGKQATARCYHCPDGQGEHREDSARHTLLECAAWNEERGALRGAIGIAEGEDLSLPAIVAAMVRDEGSWNAMASFCETVLSRKEAEEREREAAATAALRRESQEAGAARLRPVRPRVDRAADAGRPDEAASSRRGGSHAPLSIEQEVAALLR